MKEMWILLNLQEYSLYGVNIINLGDLGELVSRFAFNLLMMFVIIRFIYYKQRKKKEFFFSYFAISGVVFFLCFLLESVKLELGFALGLFAIFGIIRYRTRPIPIREMTYLFVVIGVSVINALASKNVSYAELVFTNIALALLIHALERMNYKQVIDTEKMVLHERIDRVDGQDEQELINYLARLTNLDVIRYKLGRMDYNTQTVEITVFYRTV
ncbi:DUF4956 domain-containing protein [Puteibacter caeruleilacunae]|nr:DUF4956 domain-containing protein [Puteibacter caeruleilacunae]